jgi:hypothetical protein
MQLRETAEPLTTMRAVSQVVTASERVPLQARIDTLKALHDDARVEFVSLLRETDKLIRSRIIMPSPIFKVRASRTNL